MSVSVADPLSIIQATNSLCPFVALSGFNGEYYRSTAFDCNLARSGPNIPYSH